VQNNHPANQKIFDYLSRQGRPDKPVFALWNGGADPYLGCGCHPEIVERLWDQIGKALPTDCRILVHGVPGLLHPESGIILGLGLGTQYGLRLGADLVPIALQAGAKTRTTWAGGQVMDISEELGEDWIFGCWHKSETEWCRATFDGYRVHRLP
jgi:hypothetical protein